ncbi:DUF924 family protein [Variovorax sp. J22P168]|uniref:DUF924 family protein n=1 Tax=Variovorax jilinensis TaxID=3053513 RepID=UPI002578AF4D|nr:DUF924 family protein [Variovorax sp. J22P168]MDM0013593.1 DUF924 family protein [Variovorax sp. J22P168]
MTKPLPSATDVVRFWHQAGPERWFAKDDAFDADFRSRFETLHHHAATGALDAWAADAEGALALLVLLDQLPRNAWRGSGHMFATDGKARRIAEAAIEAGFDLAVEPALRPFFYLPFMHSESLADQERSVVLTSALDANTRRFAILHRDIVARFGRFPHRNASLGRDTTPEEQQFLDQGGFAG